MNIFSMEIAKKETLYYQAKLYSKGNKMKNI